MPLTCCTRLLGLSLACSAAAALCAPAHARAGGNEAALTAQFEAARDAHSWADEGDLARQLIALRPQRWEFHRGLAESLFHAGGFQDAQPSYAKAIELASADPKARAAVGEMLIDEGDCFLKIGRFTEAIDTYDKAAPFAADPGKVYFNICMAEYTRGNTELAVAFAEKTIKADPKHADAYYIKGSLLARKAKSDPDTGKIILPDGTIEALTKYLELKPTGSHAQAVRNMLNLFQQ